MAKYNLTCKAKWTTTQGNDDSLPISNHFHVKLLLVNVP